MAAQFPLPGASYSAKLSSKMAFHDVSIALAGTSQFSKLQPGLLFVSSPLYLATRADQEALREELKIRTILSTLHPKQPRYTQGRVPGSYVAESYVVEDFLGLKTYHVHLRYNDEFIRNAIDGLPLWSKLKFQYDAQTINDLSNPDLISKAQDLVWNRDSIDESFAILTTSAPLIGRLFIDALCGAKSYPIIISGDFMLRDNGLLMFLLLLLLEVPLSTIGTAYERIAQDFFARSKEAGVQETTTTRAWVANQQHWANRLMARLEKKYGSMSAYFDSAGLSEDTRGRIKGILLVYEEKTLVDVA